MLRVSQSVLTLAAALLAFGTAGVRAEDAAAPAAAASAAAAAAPAAEAAEAAPVPEKADASKVKNQTLKSHLMNNIDIFGKTDLPAIYILMPGVDGEEDIKGSLLTRDFSRDPFFMQNVDREEFELKVTLRDFSDVEDEKEKEAKSAAKR